MGFLDQLGDAAKNIGAAAGDLAKQVGEKASDAIEISKISEALYDKFSKGGDIPEEIKEFCDNIKTRYLDIDKLKEEIEKVKNTVGEKVEEVKEAVKDKAEDAKDAVKDKAEDVKDAVVEGAEKAQDAVEDAVK